MVYKGHLLEDGGKVVTATVAIKTLKGSLNCWFIRSITICSSNASWFVMQDSMIVLLSGIC